MRAAYLAMLIFGTYCKPIQSTSARLSHPSLTNHHDPSSNAPLPCRYGNVSVIKVGVETPESSHITSNLVRSTVTEQEKLP